MTMAGKRGIICPGVSMITIEHSMNHHAQYPFPLFVSHMNSLVISGLSLRLSITDQELTMEINQILRTEDEARAAPRP